MYLSVDLADIVGFQFLQEILAFLEKRPRIPPACAQTRHSFVPGSAHLVRGAGRVHFNHHAFFPVYGTSLM